MTRIQDIAAFNEVREAGLAKLLPSKPRIGVGMGTCGSGNGAEAVFQAFASEIDARGLAVQLAPVGCFGFCAEEPLVNVWVPGRPLLILHRVQPNHVDQILGGLGQDLHLDELVIEERALELGDQLGRDALVADVDDGRERMRESAERSCRGTGEGHAKGSTRRRDRGDQEVRRCAPA